MTISEPTTQTNFHKRCANPACSAAVHRNSPTCKTCGWESPWKKTAKAISSGANLDGDSAPRLPELVAGQYVVTENFSQMIGISLCSFQEGEVLREPDKIRALLASEAPIRPKTNDDQTIVCPHCHKPFLLQQDAGEPQFSPEVAEKIRRLGVA